MNERTAIALIVVAEFFGTSLWFTTNAVASDLQSFMGLSAAGIGVLTTATQCGFILGTLVIAMTGLADRFRASRIFLFASITGAAANAAFVMAADHFYVALALRTAVGVCLAGIYPLGMKLVISWSRRGTASTLALLVAMLTLGTAFPHAMRAGGPGGSWELPVLAASALAVIGGMLVAILGDGPNLPAKTDTFVVRSSALGAFRVPAFRAAAFGYFGHMWELYAFWTLVPYLLANLGADASAIPLAAAAIIGSGAAGCVLFGILGLRIGSARSAGIALFASGVICLAFPMVSSISSPLAAALLVAWGVFVVADSPQFSSLCGKTCPPDIVGSSLALQNAIGFALAGVSILLTTKVFELIGVAACWLLVPGPVLGLFAMRAYLFPRAGDVRPATS